MICNLCKVQAPEGGFGTRVWKGESVPLLRCADCRQYFAKRRKDNPKSKASEAKHEAKESRKQKKREDALKWYNSNKDRIKAHQSKPEIKKKILKRQSEWAKTTAKGKEKVRKGHQVQYAKVRSSPALWLKECIRLKLGSVMRKHQYKDFGFSNTILNFTEFKDADDVLDHFRKQYTKGMTDENHGKGPGKWNIGHAIPRAYFDANDNSDLKRCWMKANLFPQWEHENLSQRSDLPDDAVLQQLLAAGCYAAVIGPQVPSASVRVKLEAKARKGKLFV